MFNEDQNQMGDLDYCLHQKELLQERIAQYRARLDQEVSTQERWTILKKLRVYRASLQDLQVQIDHLSPPSASKPRKPKQTILHSDAFSYDFFERTRDCGTDLNGRSRQQLDSEKNAACQTAWLEQTSAWLAEGARQLTATQRNYIDAYYNQGLSMQMIADQYEVDKSTVSKLISAGMKKLQLWLKNKRLVSDCVSEDGGVQWDRLLRELQGLTDLQRQLLVLMRTGWFSSQQEMARYCGMSKSAVSRTVYRGIRTLVCLGVPRESLFVWLFPCGRRGKRKKAPLC